MARHGLHFLATLAAVLVHLAVPLYFNSVSWVLCCLALYMFTWQFIVYLTAASPHMLRVSAVSTPGHSWPHYLCASTANVKPESRFYGWLTGGLNQHLTHHLFPTLPHYRLKELEPILAECCREFAYPYLRHDRLTAFFRLHIGYLLGLAVRDERDGAAQPGSAKSMSKPIVLPR